MGAKPRRATGYVLVLGAAMLLTVIGYAAIVLARTNTRMVVGTNDWAEAGVLAIAAAENAPIVIADKSDWRTALTSGTEFGTQNLGRGTCSIVLVDEDDGDFTTHEYGPIRAYGVGRVGEAVRVRSVLLERDASTPLGCLERALLTDEGQWWAQTDWTVSGSIHCNSTIVVYGAAVIHGDVEAVESIGTYLGGSIDGTETEGVAARAFPDKTSVFEYYVANGTEIPVGSLTSYYGTPSITDAVLTPTYNPFTGELNEQGIYVIDCEGQAIGIRNSRIVATLVLLNTPDDDSPTNSKVSGVVNWIPAQPNFPALLADGDMTFAFDGTSQMDEAVLGINLNPIGSLAVGLQNDTLDDTYPSIITGIVYVREVMRFESGSSAFQGVLMSAGGNSDASGAKASIVYDDRYYRDPPPGFGAGPYQPVAGTWRWDTLP